MKKTGLFAIVCYVSVLILMIPETAFSQVSAPMVYAGKLMNGTEPVTGTHEVKAKFFNKDGAAEVSKDFPDIPFTDSGFFQIKIELTSDLKTLFQNSTSPVFIEVSISEDVKQVQQFNIVPYAIFAHKVPVDGKTISYDGQGKLQLGSSTVENGKFLQGNSDGTVTWESLPGGGNMSTTVYDNTTNGTASGVVDNAENSQKLNGESASYYLDASHLTAGKVPVNSLPDASTSARGIVMLSNTYNAATPSETIAVTEKAIYDGLATKQDTLNPSPASRIPISNGSTVAMQPIGGDASITAGGDLTIGAEKVDSGKIKNGSITNDDINASAAIADTKLATITTAGRVSGSAITGTIGGSTNIVTTGNIVTSVGNAGIGTAIDAKYRLNVSSNNDADGSKVGNFQYLSSANSTTAINNYSLFGIAEKNFGTSVLTDSSIIHGVAGRAYLNAHDAGSGSSLASVMGISAAVGTSTGGTIGEAYGMKVFNFPQTGTIQYGYGLYVGDVYGNSSYGIYQKSNDDRNYFAGRVGIGGVDHTAIDYTRRVQIVGDNTAGGMGNVASIRGYQSAFEVFNGAGDQNWYFGVNDAGSNKLYIGMGHSPAQGVQPTIVADTSGNIGIGTTSPSEKLEVNGAIKATGGYVVVNPARRITVTARITNNGTVCGVNSQDGSWVDSVSRIALGQCSLTLSPVFAASSNPRCICTPESSITAAVVCKFSDIPTDTSIVIHTLEIAGGTASAFDSNVSISCTGTPM